MIQAQRTSQEKSRFEIIIHDIGWWVRANPGRRMPAWCRTVPGLLLLLSLSACGYGPDADVLPGGARTLALAPVANQTGTGELDVLLQTALRRRLMRHAHIRFSDRDGADLVLRVALTRFSIARVLDTGASTNRSFRFALSGHITLDDHRTDRPWIKQAPLSASASRHHAASVLETPAIRDEGINAVVDDFARKTERLIFQVF